MHEIDGEEYLTGEEAVALLGIKRATLYAYVSRGVLRSYRKGIGRERLYRRAEIAALLAVRADAPSPSQAPDAPADDGAPSPPAEGGQPRSAVSLPPAESWAGDH